MSWAGMLSGRLCFIVFLIQITREQVPFLSLLTNSPNKLTHLVVILRMTLVAEVVKATLSIENARPYSMHKAESSVQAFRILKNESLRVGGCGHMFELGVDEGPDFCRWYPFLVPRVLGERCESKT